MSKMIPCIITGLPLSGHRLWLWMILACIGVIPTTDAGTLAPGKANDAAFQNVPFDDDGNALPPRFRGVDAARLIQALRQHPPPTKGPYEASDEYQQRIEVWERKPIAGTITPSSDLAWTGELSDSNGIAVTYDADSEQLEINSTRSVCGDNQLTINTRVKQLGNYVGSNPYGVSAVVRRSRLTTECIAGIRLAPQVIIPLPRAQARAVIPQLRLLVTGRLWPPYISSGVERTTPTLDDPTEVDWHSSQLHLLMDDVWIYNSATGEILYRRQPLIAANGVDHAGNTRLHNLLGRNRTKKALALIESGTVDLNAKNRVGVTALHIAASQGNTTAVVALLKHPEVAVNLPTDAGDTALHLAALSSFNLRMIEELLRHGADPTLRNTSGELPFQLADRAGLTEIADWLRVGNDKNGNSPLHLAIWSDNTRRAMKLIEQRQTDIEARNTFGETALHTAAAKGNAQVIKALLAAGADKTATNKGGQTAWDLAHLSHHAEAAHLLQ